ncbi:hypothetical protein MMC26_002661 [Xylographa opegraphella]|nr:hypothetical protein [Xylographa opegraphella]
MTSSVASSLRERDATSITAIIGSDSGQRQATAVAGSPCHKAADRSDDAHAEAHHAPIPVQQQPLWRRLLSSISFFIFDQWFLIALGCLILLASQVQVPVAQQSRKELVVSYLCVAIIFLITGGTLPTRVLLQNYTRWKLHLFVQTQSFLLTSAIAFAVVSLCAMNPGFMDEALLVGIIFTGCVPTTISSNVVMTAQAHGDQALTVVESTLGNALGPFLTPLLVLMYTSTGAWYTKVLPDTGASDLSELYRRVFMQLGLSLFLPLVFQSLYTTVDDINTNRRTQIVGQILQNVLPGLTKLVLVKWQLKRLSSLALLLIIWQTYDEAFATGAFSSVKSDNILFVIFISIAFYAIWTVTCVALSLLWLGKKDTIAVAYCVPAKTPAMGVPLANVMFAGLSAINVSKIQIPMVIFQGFQIAAGSLLTIAFRRWIRPEEERAVEEVSSHDESTTEGRES